MRFRNLKKWNLDSDELNGLLFFAQRMEELLFDYSLDSYKAPTLNSPFLVKEALILISEIENQIIEKTNLKHVLKELSYNLRNDCIAKSLMSLELNDYFDAENIDNLGELKLRLEILFKEIHPFQYLDTIFDFLPKAISDGNKKNDIDYLAKQLSSNLINIGVSKNYLYNKTVNFFFYDNEPKISSVNILNDYFKIINPNIHDFIVYFKASKLIMDISSTVDIFAIEICEKLPDNIIKFSNEKNFSLNKEQIYITVNEIEAYDITSAMIEAEDRLSKLSDLFVMFYHKNKISWSDSAIVEQCCSNELKIVNKPNSSIEKGFDLKPSEASKRLNYLLKNMSFSPSGSGISNRSDGFERFNRVVDLHGISVSNNISENQLLNLWTSLETISPSKPSRNKINNIISQVTPFLMLNYINQLVERFASDLLHWNKKIAINTVKSLPNTKGLGYYKKCLYLLSLDENDDARKTLYKNLGDFHLLRYRAFKLNEILSNPKKLRDFMDAHEKRLAWQIRRIYRTRNLIVHSGKTPNYTNSLIENAHNYFDQVFNIVCMLSCRNTNFDTFEQAFEYTFLQYKKMKHFLEKDEKYDHKSINNLYWDY